MTNVDTNPESTHQTITAQKGHGQALAFARKGGEELSRLLGTIATTKEAERMGPVQMFNFLVTHYDDDEADCIPVVGSRQGQTGNKPYDRYSQEVMTDQGKKVIPGSWFTDVIRSTHEYQMVQERIDYLSDVTQTDCPEDIRKMGTGERATEKARLTQRKTDMRTALTKGAMLLHHVREIETISPETVTIKLPIRTEYVLDGKGEKVKIPGTNEFETRDVVYGNNIRLIDPSKELEDRVLNVNQFTALKPDKVQGAITIASLEATGARAPKGKRKGKGTKIDIPVPATVEQLLHHFNVLATALDTESEQGKMLSAKVLAACATEGEKGDDVVETIGDFITAMDDNIWTVINARYSAIKTAKAKAQNTKAHAVNQAAAG
jgi:hypothetical protein